MKFNEEVEDRRVRLMEFVQSSDELQVSRKTHNNILENVSNMQMKVLGTIKTNNHEEVIDNSVDKKKKKDVKCRYHNCDYCSQSGCVFLHPEKVCD